jgi:hypothetical protein
MQIDYHLLASRVQHETLGGNIRLHPKAWAAATY